MSDYNYDGNVGEESNQSLSLLNMAQRVHDGFITDARDKAKELLSNAEVESQTIVDNANQEAKDIVNSAIEEYNTYNERIEELKRVEFEYRARLKSAADDTLVTLENMTKAVEYDSPDYNDHDEEDDLTEEESFSFFKSQG